MRQTLHISTEVQLTLLINSTCSCIEVCYDNEEQQQEGKTFAANHNFSIYHRPFLRFAIPCCDFLHDELLNGHSVFSQKLSLYLPLDV